MTLYERTVDLGLKAYKTTLSPLIGRQCRYLPTCSEYAAQARKDHGPLKGSWLVVGRICRCNPFGGSGYDPSPPPPEPRKWKCEE